MLHYGFAVVDNVEPDGSMNDPVTGGLMCGVVEGMVAGGSRGALRQGCK